MQNTELSLTQLKRFKQLVESQWPVELGSLGLKDINEKAAIKSKLLPLTEDIIKLKTYLEKNCRQ